MQVNIKVTSSAAEAKSITSRATSLASIGMTRVRWNLVKGQGMGRMRRVIEKTRSIETVFVEEILAGVAAVERLVSIVWLLTSIAIEYCFSWIHN